MDYFIFRKTKSHNCDGVCKQIEYHALTCYENLFAQFIAYIYILQRIINVQSSRSLPSPYNSADLSGSFKNLENGKESKMD